MTTAQFIERTNAVARGLLRAGLTAGQSVGILAENGADYLAAYMGIMRAGLVAVPISHKLPAEIVRHIMADSGCRLVLADSARRELAGDLPIVEFGGDGADGFERFLQPGPFETVRRRPGDVASTWASVDKAGRELGWAPRFDLADMCVDAWRWEQKQ